MTMAKYDIAKKKKEENGGIFKILFKRSYKIY